MKKTKLRLKRIMLMLLAFAMVFTSMPLSAFVGIADRAEAATGRLSETNLSAYDFKSSRYLQIFYTDYADDPGTVKIGSCTEAGMKMKMFEIDGFLVFCNEHGVIQKSVKLNRVAKEYADFFKVYKNAGYLYAVDNMYKVLMYGPVEGSSMSELINDLEFKDSRYYDSSESYTKGAWVAATQMLIWESQQLMRNEKFERVPNGLYYQTGYKGKRTSPIKIDHYTQNLKGTPAMDIYNFIASQVKTRNKFDKTIASIDKAKPTKLALNFTEEEKSAGHIILPHTETLKASSYSGDYIVVDEKGKKVKGINIEYDKTAKQYTITLQSEEVFDKTLRIKHDDNVAKRAEKYLKGPNGSKYKQYFYEYKTKPEGHTQGFISGLEDPVTGYLIIPKSKDKGPAEGSCNPPDVEVFPNLHFPIEKISGNEGFDGDSHTPEGDAGFDATYTLYRSINGGAEEAVQSITLDNLGTQEELVDQPFKSSEDLKKFMVESGSITGCSHPITNDKGEVIGYEHPGTKEPARRDWNVTVNYRIVETRPDGRYIDPDKYGGEREYSFTYTAETHDTCQYFCDELPWTAVQYKFDWQTTLGDGNSYSDGLSEAPQENLNYDLETFVNDNFRGNIQLTKSNEKYDPFKDSGMGGSEMNQSQKSYWTLELISGGFEGEKYPHLVSETPQNLRGINVYKISRGEGIPNNTINDGLGMKVGTEGKLIIEDVPYGEYLVREVKADDPMYVLEEFVVKVDEHNPNGNRVPDTGLFAGYSKEGENGAGFTANGTGDYYNNVYSANIRDKVKSNIVKLVKTDSETGKIVRMKGTKVFLRFKGNPDFTEEENIERYGETGSDVKGIYNRFLPNAESIDSKSTNYVFELDANGEFIIPYELPYGRYEVLEWLLPNGYYVGRYDEAGEAESHNFGMIEEGVLKYGDTSVDGNIYNGDGHKFEDTVTVFDKDGNKVVFKDKDEYKFDELKNMITNTYTFEVTKQNTHVDGNYTQLTDYTGKVSKADPSYYKGDFPYIPKYTISAVLNNSVKGKIEIEKKGEALVGFEKKEKDGFTIFEPIYEMVAKLKDTVFGIFAAEDALLNDGSEGPKMYDAKTDENIVIPKEKSTHLSNIAETVKAFFGKLLKPKEYKNKTVYETGSLHHESGADLWYMLERAKSEGNVKRTIYLTPEQKDTVYSYVYETQDELFKYRYDIQITLKNQAGGRNVTDVNVTKTTTPLLGSVAYIPLSVMTGTVGEFDFDGGEIENYSPLTDPLDWKDASMLEAYKKTYTFEADGNIDKYLDGTEYQDDHFIFGDDTQVDLSKYAPKRFTVKEYTPYKLKLKDLKEVKRELEKEQLKEGTGIDQNNDGDYEDEGDVPPVYETVKVEVTKTKIEWDMYDKGFKNFNLTKKEKESPAIFTDGKTYKSAVTGYYVAGDYENLVTAANPYKIINSDENGKEILTYTLPEGFTKIPFTGDKKNDPQYIIASKANEETGDTEYKVLLNDMVTWQDCDAVGNFIQGVVQVYKVTYTQEKNDPNGFTLNFDGFALDSNVNWEENVASTIVTKQPISQANERIDIGAGYEYFDEGNKITFNTIPITAPIYFMSEDGIKTEMYYKGGVAYTK